MLIQERLPWWNPAVGRAGDRTDGAFDGGGACLLGLHDAAGFCAGACKGRAGGFNDFTRPWPLIAKAADNGGR